MSPSREYKYRSMPELSADRFMYVRGYWPRGPHLSRFATVGAQQVGVVGIWTPFGTVNVHPGEVLWLPGGVIHSLLPDNKRTAQARTVYVSEEHLHALTDQDVDRSVADTIAVVRKHEVFQCLVSLNQTALAGQTATRQELDDCMRRLLRLVPESPRMQASWSAYDVRPDILRGVPEAIYRARELMDSREDKTLTIAHIAKACGLSRAHLTREFIRYYALPPKQWFLLKRTIWAKELLEAGESISNAALEAGFSDQSHLHRWFRKVYLVSPGDFARVVVKNRALTDDSSS